MASSIMPSPTLHIPLYSFLGFWGLSNGFDLSPLSLIMSVVSSIKYDYNSSKIFSLLHSGGGKEHRVSCFQNSDPLLTFSMFAERNLCSTQHFTIHEFPKSDFLRVGLQVSREQSWDCFLKHTILSIFYFTIFSTKSSSPKCHLALWTLKGHYWCISR